MKNNRNFNNSLSRGLLLLSVLAENSSPLNLTQLSKQLHMGISTIQRFTYTLQQLGYLARNIGTKKFLLGPKAISLGSFIMKNFDLSKVALPFLEETSKKIGETVNLAILDEMEVVYLERIKTKQILNINLHVGSRLPAYCTSMGKAIMAFLPEDRLKEILEKTYMVPLSPFTITRTEDLKRELQKVRNRGFAINNEELSIGLRSVAAPVRDIKGEVIAAVNIAVPSVRITQKKLETVLSKSVMETADKISAILGYKKGHNENQKQKD